MKPVIRVHRDGETVHHVFESLETMLEWLPSFVRFGGTVVIRHTEIPDEEWETMPELDAEEPYQEPYAEGSPFTTSGALL